LGEKNILTIFLLFFIGFLIIFFLIKIFYQKKVISSNGYIPEKNNSIKINFNELKNFLDLEKAFYFDPLNLIRWIEKPDKTIVLIDIRDKNSFNKEHIKGAINLQSINQIVDLFKNKKLTVVIYGNYSNDPQTKFVAYQLINQGIKTKILSIGYNEFRHLKILWLPQSLWDKINLENFI